MYDFNKFTLDIEKIIYVNEITLEHEGILVGKIHWLLKKDNNYNEFKIKTLNTMLNHKKSKIVSFYTFIYDAEIKKVMHTYLREAIYEDINTFINLKDENLLFYKALYVDELKELKKYKNLPFSKYSL